MPKFVTIGYGDQAGYERTPQDVRDAAHAHEQRLRESGAMAVVGIAGRPVQVRNHGAVGAQTTPRAYTDPVLPVAGFAVIEAADLDEAVRLVSGTPCAVAHGVVEVWPLLE